MDIKSLIYVGMDDHATQMTASAWAIFSSVSVGSLMQTACQPSTVLIPESVLAGWLQVSSCCLAKLLRLVVLSRACAPAVIPLVQSSIISLLSKLFAWPKPELSGDFHSLVWNFASVPLWKFFSGKLISIPTPFCELAICLSLISEFEFANVQSVRGLALLLVSLHLQHVTQGQTAHMWTAYPVLF